MYASLMTSLWNGTLMGFSPSKTFVIVFVTHLELFYVNNLHTKIGFAFLPLIHSSAVSAGTSPAVSGYKSSWNSSDWKRKSIYGKFLTKSKQF